MNKNIYPGLALAVCMGVVSAPLFAEVSPTPEQLDDITAPETSAPEHLEPSELQREQEEHKADVNAPASSTKEPLESSGLQKQQAGHKAKHKTNKHKVDINAPATSTQEPREPLEPSELQRQQEEHNRGIAK